MHHRRASKCKPNKDTTESCYWKYLLHDHTSIQIYEGKVKNNENLSCAQYLKHISISLGTHFHPNLKNWINGIPSISYQSSKRLDLELAEKQSVSYKQIQFNSIMVDDITFKVLNELISLENIASYKFINNQLSDSNLMFLIDLIQTNSSLDKFTFNYNKSRAAKLLEIANFKNITYLSLKANNITDNCLEMFLKNIVNTSSFKLKYLDLHDNKITLHGIEFITEIIKALPLEFIGLGKNQFRNIKEVQPVLEFGYLNELNQRQKEEYLRLLEDKRQMDEMVSKKKKLPKRLQDVKISGDIFEQDNKYYRIKKPSLSLISLIENNFQQSAGTLIPMFEKVHKKCQVVLSLNNFSQKTKLLLRQYSNIMI